MSACNLSGYSETDMSRRHIPSMIARCCAGEEMICDGRPRQSNLPKRERGLFWENGPIGFLLWIFRVFPRKKHAGTRGFGTKGVVGESDWAGDDGAIAGADS
jgi:hypothetical protein